MKLNPKKCTFEIEEGTFLRYKVNTEGITVCPDKVGAVLNLPSPKCLKDVQKLNGKLASLNRFLSKSAENSLPFFKTLKKCTKKSDFQWTVEAEAAFKEMKRLIAKLPTLTAPMEKEELIVYLAAAREAVNGSGAGLILTNPEGAEFTYALRFRFDATNNEAEYEALIAGQRIAEQMSVKNLQAIVDSRLVANQVNGSYIAKEPGMIQYLEKVKVFSSNFKKFSIKQVPRSENKKVDALSKIASTRFAHLTKQVLVEELKEKSINEAEVLEVIEEEGDTWMTPIYNYLTEETLPAEKEKARVVRLKSGSMHAGTRSVVAKAIRTGYYWPTIHTDARKLIRACQDCQVHRLVPRNPQQKLTPIMSSWPFYKWEIDIAGPFSEGPEKVKFLIVAMDYFTKWFESKPVATITANGLVERENRSLGEGIKARLDERSKDWIEELPHVVWAHRTMIKSSNGDTPFSLMYGMEAVIPAEIGMPTIRTAEVDKV
ncbi:reverse transcriptase domain-containing protein [Tanacetum coccineum]